MAMTQCGECGREISDKAAACPGCGAELRPYRRESKKRSTAALLGIFLGGLRVYRGAELPVNDRGAVQQYVQQVTAAIACWCSRGCGRLLDLARLVGLLRLGLAA